MRICLIGYGKMGKAIEHIALERGHQISGRVGQHNIGQIEACLVNSDVAIEFTIPAAAMNNIKLCSELDIPVVCGTTGWLDQYDAIKAHIIDHNGSLVYASNFSIGVQLFFHLNKQLAQTMAKHDQYHCSLEEIHHKQKLDAPSGTALHLAKDIITLNPDYSGWALGKELKPPTLSINAIREDGVVGTHSVTYKSSIDEISIGHKAYSREGFAMGAVIAAEWLQFKKGIFTMSDVLGLNG